MILGTIIFSTKVLNNYRGLHRVNGYLYVLSVAVVVLTSGYMLGVEYTLSYMLEVYSIRAVRKQEK
ncbi:hypothetical protein P4H70_09975 [Paenibacillus ehimensis]|uniref:hypothetical protein n=1 Tax=Paenibacillus ehimensis TaxID=79264 RepID=UPI002DBD94C8|nr:hypothetical protein [Paenibacillus ehimensis]MEC0209252.1 hypothetical protein [Paenibacillus ehimensis]